MHIKNWYPWQVTNYKKVKTHHFNIVDYTSDDFSCTIETLQDTLEYIAEEIAEGYYNKDPRDPSGFECKIQILHNSIVREFDCHAEAEVNFHSREIKKIDGIINSGEL